MAYFLNMYHDMVQLGTNFADENLKTKDMENNESKTLEMEILDKAIPDIDWRKGHSGEFLSPEDAKILDELWEEIV